MLLHPAGTIICAYPHWHGHCCHFDATNEIDRMLFGGFRPYTRSSLETCAWVLMREGWKVKLHHLRRISLSCSVLLCIKLSITVLRVHNVVDILDLELFCLIFSTKAPYIPNLYKRVLAEPDLGVILFLLLFYPLIKYKSILPASSWLPSLPIPRWLWHRKIM